MLEHLLYLREEHGDVFATRLSSGQTIPWRPLSMGDYVRYQDAFKIGFHPRAYLENLIFKQCVLDTALVKGINKLKAGTVETVAVNILAYSGPSEVNELNQVLEINREVAGKIINDLVSFVCQAFPAYKPEDVYAMDYATLMLRVAMSERKLLQTGMITEPMSFTLPETEAKTEGQKQQETIDRREKNSQMMDRYYEQQGITVSDTVKQARAETREKIFDHPKPPTLPMPSEKQTIITKADIMEHQTMLSGHDQDVVSQHKSARATAHIYENYMDELEEGKKLKILTPEERKAIAMERMEKNRLANIESYKEALQAAKEELPELLKVREEARERKRKKLARRRK